MVRHNKYCSTQLPWNRTVITSAKDRNGAGSRRIQGAWWRTQCDLEIIYIFSVYIFRQKIYKLRKQVPFNQTSDLASPEFTIDASAQAQIEREKSFPWNLSHADLWTTASGDQGQPGITKFIGTSFINFPGNSPRCRRDYHRATPTLARLKNRKEDNAAHRSVSNSFSAR